MQMIVLTHDIVTTHINDYYNLSSHSHIFHMIFNFLNVALFFFGFFHGYVEKE